MKRARIQIRRYGASFAWVILLAVIGTTCGYLVLVNERLPNPFERMYPVRAAFSSAAGVVPDLGEPVDVSGVHVGLITKVGLLDGQAVITMSIDRSVLAHVYANATAQLEPETPLDNMEIDLNPGSRDAGALGPGATISIASTISPTQSDEVLASLDTDTRTWVATLIAEVGGASAGRGPDLRRLLEAVAPTADQALTLTRLLASRRRAITAIVHNLALLTRTAAGQDGHIATALTAGRRTLDALSAEDAALGSSVTQLPAVLDSAQRSLTSLATLSRTLAPTATGLLPAARRLPGALADAGWLSTALRRPLSELPGFITAVTPLTRQLPGLDAGLAAEAPELSDSFRVTEYFANEAAYSTPTNPGFLFWLAWAAHDVDSTFSTRDAQGSLLRAELITSCSALTSSIAGPILKTLFSTAGC